MTRFWERGALFVKELQELYAEPKPHFNTLSTMVRGLEAKGFLSHRAYGNTYQSVSYTHLTLPTTSRRQRQMCIRDRLVTEEQFRSGTLRGVISKYFHDSYLNAVSTLVREEKISVEELRELIERIEKGKE